MKKLFIIFVGLILLAANSCKKESTSKPEAAETGSINLEFDQIADANNLDFDVPYRTANGDSVMFEHISYYISNIVLKDANNKEYTVPQDSCYFLISESANDEKTEFTINNIPASDYNQISFLLGIDTAHCTHTHHHGIEALNVGGEAKAMYNTASATYCFMKLSGSSQQGSQPVIPFSIQTALDKSDINTSVPRIVLRAHLGNYAHVRSSITPEMHIKVNVMELLKNPNNINLRETPNIKGGSEALKVCKNYVDMFELEHIHN